MTLELSITSTADTALWETGASDIIMIYANPFNVNVNYLWDGQETIKSLELFTPLSLWTI